MPNAKMEKPKKTLLQISDDLLALDALLEETGGEIVDSVIDKWLADIGEARDEKLDNYAALIRDRELRAAALKEEAERLTTAAKVAENRAKSMKNRLELFFSVQNLAKIETPRYTLARQLNGGKTPIEIDPKIAPKELPPRFQRVTIDFDNDAIRTALESGEKLAFATIGTKGHHIRIK